MRKNNFEIRYLCECPLNDDKMMGDRSELPMAAIRTRMLFAAEIIVLSRPGISSFITLHAHYIHPNQHFSIPSRPLKPPPSNADFLLILYFRISPNGNMSGERPGRSAKLPGCPLSSRPILISNHPKNNFGASPLLFIPLLLSPHPFFLPAFLKTPRIHWVSARKKTQWGATGQVRQWPPFDVECDFQPKLFF